MHHRNTSGPWYGRVSRVAKRGVSRLRDDHDEAGLTAGAWGKDPVTYADATAFRVRPGIVKKHFPERRRSRGGLGKVTLRPGGSANNLEQRHAVLLIFSGSGIETVKFERPSLQVNRAMPLTAHAIPNPLPRDVRGDRRRESATSAEGGPGHR